MLTRSALAALLLSVGGCVGGTDSKNPDTTAPDTAGDTDTDTGEDTDTGATAPTATLDTETGRLSLQGSWGDAQRTLELRWLGGAAWLEATASASKDALDLSAILPQCADTVLQLAAGCGASLTVTAGDVTETLAFTLPTLAWAAPDGLSPPATAGRMALDAEQIGTVFSEPVSTDEVLLAVDRGRLVGDDEWIVSTIYTMYATGDIAGRVLDRSLAEIYPKGTVTGQYPITNAFFDDGTLCFAVGGLPGLNPAHGSCADRGEAVPAHSTVNLEAPLHNDLVVDPVHGGHYSLGWTSDINGRSASTVVKVPYDTSSRSFTGEATDQLLGLHELFNYDGTEDVYGNSLSIDDGYMCGTMRLVEAGASYGWCAPMGADGPSLQNNFEDVILFTRDDFVSSGLLADGFDGSVVTMPSDLPLWPEPTLGPHRLRTATIDEDRRVAFFYVLGDREAPTAVFVLDLERDGARWQGQHRCTATVNKRDYFYGDVIAPPALGASVQDDAWAFGMLNQADNRVSIFDQHCASLGGWNNTSGNGQWIQGTPLLASAGSASGLDSVRVHYDWPALAALSSD